jgi:hypothetical protein
MRRGTKPRIQGAPFRNFLANVILLYYYSGSPLHGHTTPLATTPGAGVPWILNGRATRQMRDVATRLIAHETSATHSSEAALPAAFHVLEKLRPHLATMMGNGGFRAVLSRSLALAAAKDQSLAAMELKADGASEGWERLEGLEGPEKVTECSIRLVAQLLGLLAAFIGENLTLRLVRNVWPKLPLEDL